MKERPRVIQGLTYRIPTGHGNVYVVVNTLDGKGPFEVFVNCGKAGGCVGAMVEAIARLISLSLRSGVDPEAIVEQLQGITCCPVWHNGRCIKSVPDAVAYSLHLFLTRSSNGQSSNPSNQPSGT